MSTALLLLIATFVIAALFRFPLGFGMLAAGIVYLFASGQDVGLAAEQIMTNLNENFVLLAVPLFIFAANVMNAGTISERLWSLCNAFVGRFRGGLAQVNVLVSVVFASMSGSAVADAAGPGLVTIRMMTRVGGYPPGFATAITAAAATIAPIIPPSIPMVLYALIANVSIGALFLGGIVPGLLMAAALMCAVALIARARSFPVGERTPRSAYARLFKRAALPLMMPVILLGGIYSGAFTPTEAAAVAGAYALVLSSIVYRAFGLRELFSIVLESARATASVGIMIAGAFIINYAVTTEQLAVGLSAWLDGQSLTPITFLLLVNALILVLGCFLDTATLLLVVVPVLLPTCKALGVDLVHFGVLMTINLMIGMITPPYGLLLFVLSALTDVPLAATIREIWPFVLALTIVLLLVSLVPGLVLWLPHYFGLGT
jgi:tripartite ATP-independent transporter DctM subunit